MFDLVCAHRPWWRDLLARSSGRPAVDRDQEAWPGSADGVRTVLDDLQTAWTRHLDNLTEQQLEQPFAYPWPQPRPYVYTVAWSNAELMKNFAEIGAVHHLHANTLS